MPSKLLKIIAGRPERVFLCLAIPFTFFFLITIPALQGWDEATHFLRAYQVSEGHFSSEKIGPNSWGGNLPLNVLQMNDAFLTDLVQSAKSNLHRSVNTGAYRTYLGVSKPAAITAPRNFESSGVYSPVAYGAPAAGIALARVLHLPLLSYIYIGRLFALIVWLVLMYYAIKRIPAGKWALFVLGLLPTTITVAVSLGPDGLIIGSAALLVAMFVDFVVRPRQLRWPDLVLALVLMLVLALTKQTYVLFSGLFLFLPLRVYGSRLRQVLINVSLILIVVGVAAAWAVSVNDIANNIHAAQRPEANVLPVEQEKYILHNPLHYAAILGNAMFTNNTNPQYTQLIGFVTWKGILLPAWVNMLAYVAIILSLLYVRNELKKRHEKTEHSPSWVSRYGPAALGLAIVVLIYTSLYVTFSRYRATVIEGVQGRYFLPLMPLLIPLLLRFDRHPFLVEGSGARWPKVFISLSLGILLITAVIVVSANYIPDVFV